MFSEPVLDASFLDAIAFHGTENSAACFHAVPDLITFLSTQRTLPEECSNKEA